MKTECLELLIDNGREIEFVYKNSRYSITYFYENNERWISICKFYKEPKEVKTTQEALKIKIGKLTIEQIFAALPDSAIDIY